MPDAECDVDARRWSGPAAYTPALAEWRCRWNAPAAKSAGVLFRRKLSASRDEFRDVAHGGRRVAEQEIGEPVLAPTGFEREGIARGEAMIEYEA